MEYLPCRGTQRERVIQRSGPCFPVAHSLKQLKLSSVLASARPDSPLDLELTNN